MKAMTRREQRHGFGEREGQQHVAEHAGAASGLRSAPATKLPKMCRCQRRRPARAMVARPARELAAEASME